MRISTDKNHATVATFHYRLELGRERLALIDPRREQVLLDAPTPLILRPEFHGRTVDWKCGGFRMTPLSTGGVAIQLTGTANATGLGPLTVTLTCHPEHMEAAASLPVESTERVAHWHLLEPGILMDLFHLHHWRNRHGHVSTVETYNLCRGGKTLEQVSDPSIPEEMARQWTESVDLTTYSHDWQFAPRPSLFLLQRDSVMLGVGSRDLPHGFGLEFKASARKLEYFRLNYGGEYGQEIVAGGTAKAPRMYFWLDHHGSIWDSVDHYVAMLVEDGMIPRPSTRATPHWWLRPVYCTWNDQGYLSGNPAYYGWPGGQFKGQSPVEVFEGPMLDTLLDVIAKERYPFGAVIIDDGWQKTRGDWTAHPVKFPNLREQIDRIHRMDMKVILWIAPFDYCEGADIRKRAEWLCGGGILGRHKMPLVDYSNPRVQAQYVKPLMRHLFSDAKGCLNADGFKTDFMADKIHPVFPVHDPEWRGEERFIQKTLQLWRDQMKAIKPDAQVLGCTAHPFFIPCQDLVRTYDVPVSQFQHADRAMMIRHFNPGNRVAIDLCETRSLADVEEHLDIACRHNLLYECGRIAPDPSTGVFSAGPDYPSLLRRKLRAWGD